MLLQKKPKHLQEKTRCKNVESSKKVKKNKLSSPARLKVTPDKVHKKDENNFNSKNNMHNHTQPIQLQKYKEKEVMKSHHKRSAAIEQKNKLLNTSPVVFDRSTSRQYKKSKDKSKSRSVSRLNTNRSNHLDRQKELIKNVTKKLYTQTKETLKNKSASKSKSKNKIPLTDRDVSPLKEIKRPKEFNVADREVKFIKAEPNELKKCLKKKIKGRMKMDEQLEQYAQTQRVYHQKEQPKVKLKKKVPQIKTEFSQRRGSFFDQNLLKRLQLGQSQVLKTESSPFVHIKSNFCQKNQNEIVEISSRQQIKTYEEANWQSISRAKQLQSFKRQQELKWSRMLHQLQSLKQQKKVSEKIDEMIRELNQNYSSLQQKVCSFMKNKQKEQKQATSLDFKFNAEQEKIVEEESQDFFQHLMQKEQDNFKVIEPKQQLQKKIDQKEVNRQLNEIKISEQIQIGKESDCIQSSFQPEQQQKQGQNKNLEARNQVSKGQQEKNLQVQPITQVQNKKINSISLNNDFFDFFENKKKLKLDILDPCSPSSDLPQAELREQVIKQMDEHKQSDQNLLQELNILDGPSDFIEVISFNKTQKTEFEAELEQIRQIQNEQFQQMVPLDFAPHFGNELKMPEQISEDSLLLPSHEVSVNLKLDKLVEEIFGTLIMQFGTSIIRSKQILHNFLTTYSELVQTNVINAEQFQNRVQIPCSNQHVLQVLNRLLNHLQIDLKDYFMKQIKIPFACSPLDMLRFIRCSEEQWQSQADEGQMELALPFFGLEKIEEFQSQVLKNQYYIPHYFSFNQCIYDHFNDNFDELRPYGNRGKPLFSLRLSHSITSFQEGKRKMIQKFQKTISTAFYQEILEQERGCEEQGVFEMTYFLCIDVLQQLFQSQAALLLQLQRRRWRCRNQL